MQTSGTGRWTADRQDLRGFTLLELMVVLVIVGVMASLARLAVPDGARTRLDAEAQRLVHTLDACRRGAVLSGVPRGVGLTAEGYTELQYRGSWRASDDASSAGHALAAGVVLQAAGHGPSVVANDLAPAVVCLPTGEILMSVLHLGTLANPTAYAIADDESGAILATWSAPPT